jgi:hypothetical protein
MPRARDVMKPEANQSYFPSCSASQRRRSVPLVEDAADSDEKKPLSGISLASNFLREVRGSYCGGNLFPHPRRLFACETAWA